MDKITLAQTIHSLFQAQDAQSRDAIEAKLKELEQDDVQHINNVVQILHDNSSPEIQQIKQSIAIYLRNFMRTVTSNSHNDQQKLKSLIEIFFVCCMSDTIDISIKKHLILILEGQIMIYQSVELNEDIIKSFYDTLFEQIQQKIGSQNLEVVKGALLVCQTAMQTVRTQAIIAPAFVKIAQVMTGLVDITVQNLNPLLQAVAQEGQSIAMDNPNVQKVFSYLDLLYLWGSVHESILERNKTKKWFAFQHFILNQGYVNSFAQILTISMQMQNQPPNCLLSISGLQKLDNIINQVKTKALECIIYLYRYLYENCPTSVKSESPFVQKGVALAQVFIGTSIIICQREDFETLIQDENNANFLIELVEILTIFVNEKEFYDLFQNFYKHLLIIVCLNMLRTYQEELLQMINDPENFVNLALDTCDKQNSRVVKTQGAKLLEQICDNIDGAVSFITIFTCQSLQFALKNNKEIDQKTQDLSSFKQTTFLQAPAEIIGETCLVVLTAISYTLPRRTDLVPFFEAMLASNIDIILAPDSIILRSRMSLLIGYYADMLFKNHQAAFLKIVEFLFTSISLKGDQKVVALQSADTLNTIISDTDLVPRLEPHLPQILAQVNQANLKLSNKLYFNFLLDLVKHYFHAFKENIIPFLNTLVERIKIELHSCHEKGEKNNIIINKCWNVIRVIVDLKDFMNNYYTQIEESLKPLFEFMVDPQKIEFEDDIVLALKSFIKRSNQVSPTLWIIFPHLTKVFEKNKLMFGNLLETLNYYLLFGKQEMAQNREHLNVIIDMANRSLYCKEERMTSQNSEGAILFQLLFQVYMGSNCLEEQLVPILEVVVGRLKIEPMQNHLKRHLFNVFLSACAYNSTKTIQFLESQSMTEEFLKQLFQLTNTYKNAYERKLFVTGLSHMLSAPQLPVSLGQSLQKVIDEIVKVLNAQKIAETKKFRKDGKKEIKAEIDDEEDGDDEDDEDDEEDYAEEDNSDDQMEEEKKGDEGGTAEEAKGGREKEDTQTSEDESGDDLFDLSITINLLNSPVKHLDEFRLFSESLRTLYSKDAQYMNNLISQLSEGQKKFLKEHVETKRIQIEYNGVQTEVARKIIKVKRRTNPLAAFPNQK